MAQQARLSIEIDAPVGLVWKVLTDIDAYGSWNPMTPKVTGKLAEGETLQLTARVGTWIRTQDQKVYEIVPERKLVWSGAFGGELVRGVRTQWLEPLPDGRTRYSTQDLFAGPLAGVTRSLYGETLHAGFQAMAEALKDTCEARAGTARLGQTAVMPIDLEQRRLPQRASWYVVSIGADLRPGDTRRVSVCGQDVIVWRTQGGRVGAARNVCGHMASRLAPGACVKGEQLVCGHHGVGFTATGHACEDHARDLSTLPVREIGPLVYVWYHPAGASPTFEVPDLPTEGWSTWTFQTLDLPVHPQHVMEDLADLRHFLTIHGYRTVQSITPTRADAHTLTLHGRAGWDPGIAALPSVPVEFRTTAHGLGFQITDVKQLDGVSHSRHLVLPTPIDDHHTRITLGVSARLGDDTQRRLGLVSPLARAAVHGVVQWAFRRDVLRDAQLWTQRHHVEEGPPPQDFDRAVFQRWLEQFDMPQRVAA